MKKIKKTDKPSSALFMNSWPIYNRTIHIHETDRAGIIHFSNYFKIAVRNIKKHKGYSFINIMGLAVGIACAILIFMWVDDELSYDNFHSKSDRIYRLCSRITINGTTLDQAQTPAILPPTLKQDFPEVEQTVKLGWPLEIDTQYEGKVFMETDILPVDSTFFEVFSFKLIRGDALTALTKPFSIVVTEETAERYFGNDFVYAKKAGK